MNYDVICSKCPLLADTHACSRLRYQYSFSELSVYFSGKGLQFFCKHSVNSACLFIVFAFTASPGKAASAVTVTACYYILCSGSATYYYY